MWILMILVTTLILFHNHFVKKIYIIELLLDACIITPSVGGNQRCLGFHFI